MEQTQVRSFTAQVVVAQGTGTPVSITTEPPLEGQPLAQMYGWLENVRADLKDGVYTITLGAAEDGIQGTGPDERTANLLRTRLHTPMTEVRDDLTEAYRWNGLDDDAFVAALAKGVMSDFVANLRNLKPEVLKPGFIEFRVGCPNCGDITGLLEVRLGELAELNIPEEEHDLRRSFLGFFQEVFGLTPRPATPESKPVHAFIPGAEHGNPFERPANARLQTRVDRLAPRIEAAMVAQLGEYLAGSRGRVDGYLSALRENFPA